jgi:DNA-binding transcriptional ArsR family regulator
MQNSSNKQESRLLSLLIDALEQVPGTRAEIDDLNPSYPESRIDAIMNAHIAGSSIRLAVECRQQVFPRDARQTVWQLRNFISRFDNGTAQWLPLVAAGVISPGARDLFRSEDVGYFDSGGSLYLPARGAFVFIEKPAIKAEERKVGIIFKGRRALVLHAAWEHRHQWLGVNQIAEVAKVAPATASETLMALERHGWVDSRGAGPSKERRLLDPRGLLDAWTEYRRIAPPQTLRKYFVPESRVEALMTGLDRACKDNRVLYAITGEAAAQSYAPYLSSISQVRCRMMAGAPADAALRALDARPVKEGWNLGIMDTEAEGEFSFRQRGESAWLASPLQVYLDLLEGPGRSPEMAAHLREQRLQ